MCLTKRFSSNVRGLPTLASGCEEKICHECVGQRRCSIQGSKLKVMGLEIVRSSTPAPVTGMVERVVSLCLNQDEKDLQNYVEETWEKFKEFTRGHCFPSWVQQH